MTTVTDYNTLMKEFPLNELISAADMASVTNALTNIFTHMKKLRSTKYPISRALRFVECISRDLNAQILKVSIYLLMCIGFQILSTRRLMHIPINEFDQLTAQCMDAYKKWDDEYDKFITMIRDISKKNRDETMKYQAFKAVVQHKKLETRLGALKQFRK